MIFLIGLLVAVFALIFGLSLGIILGRNPKTIRKQINNSKEIAEISKEYENFLNYDGSVQQ